MPGVRFQLPPRGQFSRAVDTTAPYATHRPTDRAALLRSSSSLRDEQHRPKAIFPLRSYYLTLLLQTLIMIRP
jgi:hypothetical protein